MLLLTDERIKLQVDVGWMLYSYVDPWISCADIPTGSVPSI